MHLCTVIHVCVHKLVYMGIVRDVCVCVCVCVCVLCVYVCVFMCCECTYNVFTYGHVHVCSVLQCTMCVDTGFIVCALSVYYACVCIHILY